MRVGKLALVLVSRSAAAFSRSAAAFEPGEQEEQQAVLVDRSCSMSAPLMIFSSQFPISSARRSKR
jgi:hypothetical protein